MAFLISCVIKAFLLFEIAITGSKIAAESEASWNPMEGPFVLVRLKRSPQRAITYSGFNPTNGLTAFATSADFLPYYSSYPSQFGYPVESRPDPYAQSSAPSSLTSNRGDPYTPSASTSNSSPPSEYSPDYQPSAEYPSSNTDENRKLPSQNLTPPSEQAPNTAYNQNTFQQVKKPNKKPVRVEDEDDDDNTGKSRSSSSASFNAWFPIVLGMYPSRGGPRAYKEDANASLEQERYSDRGLGTTVIANSVSHGKSSVASSHAIAYGGEEPRKSSYHRG